MLNPVDLSVHNFAYSAEDEKTESTFKSLKRLVDVTGIEPVTPCLQEQESDAAGRTQRL